VRPLPAFGYWELLLIKPAFGLSTPEVYGEFDRREQRTRFASRIIEDHLLSKNSGGTFFSILNTLFHNDLQAASCALRPEVGQLILDLENRGAVALMSGSGPTVMGFFSSTEERENACAEYLGAGYQCHLVQTIL
jgi:4-diphosphocytidyl-2-C-methyl-D-erythritol kinase